MRILGTVASSLRKVPSAPTIGTATDVGTGRAFNNGAATVTFTAPSYNGGLPITSYTVTSSPGGFTATGASSPLTVTGLASSTAYTFTVTATNAAGTSAASAASNSITATTVPQAPTIGTATAGNASASVAFTANANGGKSVTTFTATSSPGSITGTNSASPITVSGLSNGTAYTFTVTATNANGTSTASAASNSVTPAIPALSAWSAIGNYPEAQNYMASAIGGGYLWSSGGRQGADTTRGWRSTDGVTWSSLGTFASLRWGAGGAYDGTRYQQLAGYNQGNVANNDSIFTTGSGWSTGTGTPYGAGAVRAWSIGSAIGVGGYWPEGGGSETASYYRTGTGAWSTGATLPVNASTIDGFSTGASTNREDRSVAYGLAPRNTSNQARVYSETSISGAWTTTYGPLIAAIEGTRPSMAYANGYVFVWGGDNDTLNNVRGNGSTWSAQTNIPQVLRNWGGYGGMGNNIYNWAGETTGAARITTVYRATQN